MKTSATLLTEAAERMRQMADEIDRLKQPLPPLGQTCTLKEAADRLRAMHPHALNTIEFSVNLHSSERVTVDWTVYDGLTHHKAHDLAAAVRLAEAKYAAANAPENSQTVQDVQNVLEEEEPYPTHVEDVKLVDTATGVPL